MPYRAWRSPAAARSPKSQNLFQNRIQRTERMMVRLRKMRDNVRPQRQGRNDGAIRSTADRRPMGEDPSRASETAPAPAWRQTTVQRSQRARRNSVDFAERRSLAGFARRVSLTGNVLAATSGLGRARSLAHHLARILGGTEPTRATRLERIVSGRQFRSGEKRGCKVGKPSGARARSGWWWSTARVFLWESSFSLHPRTRSGSRKKRSRRSG